jgi:nucleotide-binding universal stress UspA family protein
MTSQILICTNGFEGTWAAVEYGAWMAEAIDAPVILLGIYEDAADRATASRAHVDDIVARARDLLTGKGLRYSIEQQAGSADELIPRAARQGDCITVLGPLGRPRLKRLFLGRSIRSLLEEIPTPVVYVPRSCLPLKKMLICLGGLGYEITAEHLGVRLGLAEGAEATLLHIAPPVDLDYPTARAEREHWRDLIDTDTLPGRNLRRALEQARASGLNASVKMRQGNVVDEIVAELEAGGYDLICMGSGHSGHGLRHLYEPNVTDEIAEHAACPVLTARYAPESFPTNGRLGEDSAA